MKLDEDAILDSGREEYRHLFHEFFNVMELPPLPELQKKNVVNSEGMMQRSLWLRLRLNSHPFDDPCCRRIFNALQSQIEMSTLPAFDVFQALILPSGQRHAH